MTRAWQAYLAASAAGVAGLFAAPDRGLRDVLYVVVGASCVVAIVIGAVRNRPAARGPWLLMALGMGMWVSGDAVFSWLQDVAHVEPFPSAADYLYLAAYPLLAAGLGRLAWLRRHGRDLAASVDAAIVTLACGLVSWVVVAGPLARAQTVGL